MAATAREPDMAQFTPQTLHDRMIIEAEAQIQHNWADVAIHDKRKLRQIPPDHACIWVVRSEGSNLLPAYCELADASKWIAEHGSKVSPLVAFFCMCQDYFCKFRQKFNPEINGYYVIIKGKSEKDGKIIPVSWKEIADFAMAGDFVWTEDGYQHPSDIC